VGQVREAGAGPPFFFAIGLKLVGQRPEAGLGPPYT